MRVGAAAVMSALVLVVSGCGTGESRIAEVYGQSDSTTMSVRVKSCNRDPSPRVSESRYEVRIGVSLDGSGGLIMADCTDTVEVHLESTLGDRRVVDSATGDVMRVLPAG